MNMSVFEIIKLGRKYMLLWPERPELKQYFAEYHAVHFAKLAYKFLPGIAVFMLIMQLYISGFEQLPMALVYFFFTLSLLVQALVMLGVKADKFLPPSLATWYKEGVAKVNQNGGKIKLSVSKPRYMDLAYLLSISYQQSRH
jgi:uncharacterized membrane protein YfbV (UPF0208 family)